ELGVSGEQLRGILQLQADGKISSNAAGELLEKCCDSDESADRLAEEHGLIQVSDTGELEGYIEQVIADPSSQKAVEDIRGGKDKAVGALMGKVMKLSGGKANPQTVRQMILDRLRG
ncbi:MAG: Asp-tRNA(Asn)/Glu-tRNA(Gln) amidotransferase GatCAB subunit B, partial [Phycisphaeraceae bacterium]